MKLSQYEVEERLPVWCALSDLFVDTEMDESDHRSIALRLKKTGLSAAQIETILRDEVLPALGRNLIITAGNWDGWTADEVRELVGSRLSAVRLPFGTWWRGLKLRRLVGDDWRVVKAMLDLPEDRLRGSSTK